MLSRPFKAFSVIFIALPSANALWPQPRHLQTGPQSSALYLASSDSFTISVDEVPNAPEDLVAAAQRTHAQLFSDDLGRLVLGRGIDDLEAISNAPTLRRLVLRLDDYHTHTPTNTGSIDILGSTVDDDAVVQPIEVEARMPLGTRDEGYSLVVPADGSHAVLRANSTLGLFRGLNTFTQLWFTVQGIVYMLGVPVEIQDSPVYVRACASSRARDPGHLLTFWR
jgi:hexosaminidase